HPDKILDLMLMDSLNSELKNFAKEKLIERGIKFLESTIGCTVGAHAGERACGVFYIENC
ncbi:MAG: DegV family protein, partial [Oscillospiraceae bacterium]|nr:DegV family protein [Oscillospiraceae bacterium]